MDREDNDCVVRQVGFPRQLVRALDRLLLGADFIAKGIIGIALLGITVSVFVGVLGRYVFAFGFVGGEELARYLMIWMTFLGAYVLVREQRHIVIDIALRLMPPGARRVLAVTIGVVGIATMIYLAYTGYYLAERMLAGGRMSTVLPWPSGVLHVSLPVAAVLMAAAFLHMSLAHLLTPDEAVPLVLESEDG